MKVIIQLSREEEAKALPILLRHSPGMILPERTYVLGEESVGLLHERRHPIYPGKSRGRRTLPGGGCR